MSVEIIEKIRNLSLNQKELLSLSVDKKKSLLSDYQKHFEEKKETYLKILSDQLNYSLDDAKKEYSVALQYLTQIFNEQPHCSLGTCAIFASWSSPLSRFHIIVLRAIVNNNPVLLLTHTESVLTYQFLTDQCEWIKHFVSIVAIDETETLQLILDHPSLKGLHWSSHFYEADHLQKLNLPYLEKNLKINFGSRNPVIFLNGCDLNNLSTTLQDSLNFFNFSENRFNRWFVQEKIYPEFLESFSKCQLNTNIKIPHKKYQLNFDKQNQSLLKEKNWLEQSPRQISLDFSNCSPWHQQETLGPVLTVTRFKNINEVSKFSNTTSYAHTAAIMTEDKEKVVELSALLKMPNVFLNKIPQQYFDVTHGTKHCGINTHIYDFDFFNSSKKITVY